MDLGNQIAIWRSNAWPFAHKEPALPAKGLRVICLNNRKWGLGTVLSDDGGSKVTVLFLVGGKRTVNTPVAELDLISGSAAESPTLDHAATLDWRHAHHNLYVIEFKSDIFASE